MSDVTDALDATVVIFRGLQNGSVTLQNVFASPDDYDDIDPEQLPFCVFTKTVGPSVVGNLATGGTHRGAHAWQIHGRIFFIRAESNWAYKEEAQARTLAQGWEIKINDQLAQDETLGGTVFRIGEERGQYYDYAQCFEDHDYWKGDLYWTLYFFIPVVQIYDRGG